MPEDEETAASKAPPGAPPAVPSGSAGPYSPDPDTPQDTDDTQGRHFKRIAGSPWMLSLGGAALIIAFVIGTTQGNAAVGAGAAIGLALVVLLIVYIVAAGKAEEDFFEAYAGGRGLERRPSGKLPPSTPLLRKGDKRRAEQIMNGTLPSGLPGTLALYTFQEVSRDSDGNRQTTDFDFTVVMHDLPVLAELVGDVFCQRRSGFRFLDSAEDVFRRMQRLELESEAFDMRYEVFYGANDSENWLKQLFSPSFIVWLAESAPREMAFELSAGSLCVNVESHHDNAAELDQLCEAAAMVANRLAQEAAE